MPKLPDVTAFGERPVPVDPITRTKWTGTTGTEDLAGKGLSLVGNTMVNVSKEIDAANAKRDAVAAEDAYNQYLMKRQELTAGDDGFTKRRGKDAITGNVIPEYTGRLTDSGNEISNGLSNSRQKEFFRRKQAIADLQFKQDMLNHVTKEDDQYKAQVFEAGIQTSTASMVDRFRDPKGRQIEEMRISSLIQSEAERRGLGDQNTEGTPANMLRQKVMSKAYLGVINRHLVEGDDITAKAEYERLKVAGFKFTAEDENHVTQILEVGSTRGESQRLSQSFMAKHGNDFRLAMEDARNIKNPKLKEATLSQIRQYKSDLETSQKLEADELWSSATETAKQYKDINAVPANVFVRLGPDGQDLIKRVVEDAKNGPPKETDQNLWNEFNRNASDHTWLSGLSNKDFAKYYLSFDEEKRTRAATLRDAAIDASKGDTKAKDMLRNDLTLRQMVLGRIVDAGLIDGKKKVADYSSDDETIIYGATERASSEIEKMYGKNATVDQKREVVNRLVLEGVKAKMKDSGLRIPLIDISLPDKTKKMSEMTPDEKANSYFDYKTVPIMQRDALRQMAAEAGIKEVKDEDIARAYTLFMKTTGLPKEDRINRIIEILGGKQ